ncbi:hypothetical protein LZ32DRAFT_24766 [Colletotrichum eremochloae]|nr:hypothetical protein LZ32DRAFT_24766 [Colletotrichum eremochloae]
MPVAPSCCKCGSMIALDEKFSVPSLACNVASHTATNQPTYPPARVATHANGDDDNDPPGGASLFLASVLGVREVFACWEIFVFLFPYCGFVFVFYTTNTPSHTHVFCCLETNSFQHRRWYEKMDGRTGLEGAEGSEWEEESDLFVLYSRSRWS